MFKITIIYIRNKLLNDIIKLNRGVSMCIRYNLLTGTPIKKNG